jgi:hypothetical protein
VSQKSSKQSAKAAIDATGNSGTALKEFLKKNRMFQTALRVFHRLQESSIRGRDYGEVLQQDSLGDIGYYYGLLESLVTKVSTL